MSQVADGSDKDDQVVRASELSYRRLFEAAQDGILILDADTGRVNDANPFLIKLLGLSHSDMVGKTVGELSPFKDIVSNQLMLEQLQRVGYVRYEDLPLETKDGRKIAVEFVSNVYLVGDQKVIQCNIRDITSRKQAEEALRESERFNHATLDALGAHVAVLDEQGTILATNQAWREFAQANTVEVKAVSEGTNYLTVCEGAAARGDLDASECLKGIREVAAGARQTWCHENACHSPTEERWFFCRVTRFPGDGPVRVVVAHENITEQKKHEHEIERLSRLYAALSLVNQAVVTIKSREEFFTKVCRALVECGGFRMAWVGWLDATTRQIIPVGQWGDDTHYLLQTQFYADGRPEGQGPIGMAIGEGRNYICNDFLQDPRTLPWRQAAERAEVRSMAVFLIRHLGVGVGAIAVYAERTGIFQDREIVLLEEAAADTSFALNHLAGEEARQQADTALHESQRLIEGIMNTMPARLFWKDKSSIYQGCNLAFAHDAGFAEPKDIIGKDDYQMAWREQAEKYRGDDRNILETGESMLLVEESQTTPVGNRVTLLASKIPMRNAKGEIVGTLGTYVDITERKRVQEAHDRLAMAVEQATESVVITDTEGTILHVNPAFEKTSGYSLAEALGQTPRLLKSGQHEAGFYSRMWELLKAGEIWKGHFINRRKDGTLYEEDATISPVRDAAGTIVNFVAIKRDVTREVQLEAQFRQSQKMEAIGQLAGGVAHDFNNILAVIQMHSDLLTYGGGLSARQAVSADEISASVHRAAALTRQLLYFSRREVFQPRDLDLSESITNTATMLKRILGEDIAMHVKLATQPMFLHADAGMMDQVLLNLVVNARDAMPNGGQLDIETSGVEFDELAVAQSADARPGSFVCLSVSDSGCGIPPEILPQIFEPFFTTKVVGKGTGLGLATIFGIVQQHQGWINVYSEIGHGTTFRIYLPRLAASTTLKFSPEELTAMLGGNETILLAEDDPALRNAVRTTLSQLGYRILEASTGVRALEVWRQHRAEIGLLLTDLVMPDGMTGKVLTERIHQENPRLKVIYMSGYSTEVSAKDFALKEGVNFLNKPFSAYKLAQTVRNNLDRQA